MVDEREAESAASGRGTSLVEVTNVSKHGFWRRATGTPGRRSWSHGQGDVWVFLTLLLDAFNWSALAAGRARLRLQGGALGHLGVLAAVLSGSFT
jgi:hypothetical protein